MAEVVVSQPLQDLPDPLQPSPTWPTSSPDELLSKMADEAIDQLMADAGPSCRPSSTVQRDAAEAVDEATFDMPVSEQRPTPTLVETQSPSPATPVADAGEPETSAEPDATTVELHESIPGKDETSSAGLSMASADEATPSPRSDIRALLHDPAVRPSPLLWPLRLVNAPFVWIGDRGRTFAGLLAIVTLVPAACAIAWKFWLMKWH